MVEIDGTHLMPVKWAALESGRTDPPRRGLLDMLGKLRATDGGGIASNRDLPSQQLNDLSRGFWIRCPRSSNSLRPMSLHPHALSAGFIAPCLPSSAPRPPSGELWLHEIKHDGLRVIARKDSDRVRLYSRPGNDLTKRFPLIVESLARLRPRSCVIDGEAVACGDDAIASFDRIRYRQHDGGVFLYAFDLIELDGDDLRRDPLAVRKEALVEAGLGAIILAAHRIPQQKGINHMHGITLRPIRES
jgi:ATP-dependent DNA ligase